MRNRHTILIIEDSPLTVKILEDMLKDDYNILTSYYGIEGLEIAEKENPDLIILDILMSPMDGYETCEKLKQNYLTKSIPVIFITALGEMEDEKKGLEIGAIDYITKPFSAPIIKARVKNHLELKHSRDILAELSSLDGLTGIYNRRYFDILMEQEWNKSILSNSVLSVMLMDIDKFKMYNDNYGHLEGDECLRLVANCIKDSANKSKCITARFGGEEFVTLMPNIGNNEAKKFADNIFRALKATKIPFEVSPVDNIVTISAGLGTIYPDESHILTTFIKEVDDLLFASKFNGRNRITYKNMSETKKIQ